jgi:putative alpha-1,2-mannosidase
MGRMTYFLTPLVLFTCVCGASARRSRFAGRSINRAKTTTQQDHGNTLPGATRPFGMLYWGPQSGRRRILTLCSSGNAWLQPHPCLSASRNRGIREKGSVQ